MGSDQSPEILIKATLGFASSDTSNYVLIGTKQAEQFFHDLKDQYTIKGDLSFELASHSIEMDESPLLALRKKKKSSLLVGMRLLREGKIDAFVSAGNTGALLSCAKMHLPSLPKILRPALIALLPTKKDPVAILDIGANVTCKEQNLIQFAYLGSAYQALRGNTKPKLGLLNIGTEAVKGTSELKKAYRALSKLKTESFEFIGNVEGKEIFEGNVDVIVTDGFTGNIFLKTAEGLANFVLDRLQNTLEADSFDDLKKYLHYAEYPGAILVGTQGLVIKCHGDASPQAFKNGIRGAIQLIHQNFISKLETSLSS